MLDTLRTDGLGDQSGLYQRQLQERLRDFELLEWPGHLLRRAHQRSCEIFARLVGDDVTRQQIALLIALAKRPGTSQRELVDATGIDKSTLKEMLGRLVARAWIRRERDPSDSRAWTMSITPQGSEMLLDRFAMIEAAQREILEPLAEPDRIVFMRSLRALLDFDPPLSVGRGLVGE